MSIWSPGSACKSLDVQKMNTLQSPVMQLNNYWEQLLRDVNMYYFVSILVYPYKYEII